MRDKVIFLILIALINSLFLRAGWEERADSLKQLLTKSSHDSMRINYMLDIGDELLDELPHESLKFYQKAREVAENYGDTTLLVYSIISIGDVYSMLGEYSKAIALNYTALDLAVGNYYLLAMCHNRLSGFYYYLEDYEQSVAQNKISLMYNVLNKDTTGIAVDLNNIASYYLELDILDSAVYYFHRSMEFDKYAGNTNTSYNFSNLGHTYTYMEQYDSALYYQNMAYEMDSMAESNMEMSVDEYYLAFTYYHKNEYNKTLKYINRSIDKADKLEMLDVLIFNYELGYMTYEKLGDYKKALEYAVIRNELTDSLHRKSNMSLIKNVEAKHKYDAKQKELVLKEAENELLQKHKSLLIALCIVSVLLLASTTIIITQKQKQHKTNQKLLTELENANLAKERLLSVISHDLRGSIGNLRNAIEMIIDEDSDYETMKSLIKSFYPVVDSTYDLLENLLAWARFNKEDLQPNIERVNMLDIAQKSIKHTKHLAEGKQIEIINQVEDAVIHADKNMLLIVIRNLISNAIKFSHQESQVIIRSATINSITEIEVVDQGIGITEDVLQSIFDQSKTYHSKGTNGERGSGLGLLLCQSFIEKHNGKIWAKSNPGKGSSFFITLPLNLN